jgi:hypothetical protein
LVVPDDIGEARAVRDATRRDSAVLRASTPFLERLSGVLIDRQGHNHYIATLYSHLPREAP